MVKRFFQKWHEYCPIYTIAVLMLLPVTILLHILSIFVPAVADFINRIPAQAVRFILAKMTGFLPFSLAEICFIILLPLAIFGMAVSFKLAAKEDPKPSRYYLSTLLGVFVTLYILFVFTLGTSYFTTTVDKELALDKNKIAKEELFETADEVRKQAEKELDNISFREDGSSVMPYDLDTLNDKLNKTYATVAEKYDFIPSLSSNVKPILFSRALTYTHMSGLYTYITGEANINTHFPDSTLPFTMAHEMAHQRGIAREDEANFVAFLVTMESDDPYIRYSGYYEIFKYFVNALYATDNDLFKEIYARADKRLVNEILAFNEFFKPYENSTAANVTGTINNAYQQIQGVEAGIASYGLCVDLTVAYHQKYGSLD
ncbi:MAG: DUF3810 domain-containing protein [Clostridia bacterium]|nr:DUF3810 domain-containing protein [Clostridia bacterium]